MTSWSENGMTQDWSGTRMETIKTGSQHNPVLRLRPGTPTRIGQAAHKIQHGSMEHVTKREHNARNILPDHGTREHCRGALSNEI